MRSLLVFPMKITVIRHAGKKPYERAVKVSVSMPEIMYGDGTHRMRQYGYSVFSHYVQHLMRLDIARGKR